MKTLLYFSIFSAALALIGSTSALGGFTYDETTDGDLPSVLPLPIFSFEIGTNTINGSLWINVPTPSTPELDGDKFAFRVPNGGRLDSIDMTFVDDMGDFVHSGWFLRSGLLPFGPSDAPEFIEGFPAIPSPSNTSWTQVPLAPGIYNLATGGIGTTISASANYTISFSVSEVPEPTSLTLLGIAFSLWVSLPRKRLIHQS